MNIKTTFVVKTFSERRHMKTNLNKCDQVIGVYVLLSLACLLQLLSGTIRTFFSFPLRNVSSNDQIFDTDASSPCHSFLDFLI